MGHRRDTSNMTEKELLSEIYEKVEILDDIVRGDADRDIKGMQKELSEVKEAVGSFKQAKLVRQTILASAASLITLLASVATIITVAWQGQGG